jgi:hypothetical protein
MLTGRGHRQQVSNPDYRHSAAAHIAFRVGSIIGVVRIGLYLSALALYTGHSDWGLVVGYALLIVNSGVELAIASVLNGRRPGSTLAVTALIVLTSAALGCGWAWIRWRSSDVGAKR